MALDKARNQAKEKHVERKRGISGNLHNKGTDTL